MAIQPKGAAYGAMDTRVARYADLAKLVSGFPDNPVEGCKRTTLPVIGFQYEGPKDNCGNVTRPPISLNTALPFTEGVSICYVTAEPGQGTLFHRHIVNETFVCMQGIWRCFWRENDGVEKSIDLGRFDTFAVPAGVMRRFECLSAAGDGELAHLMAIVISDAPRAEFSEDAQKLIAQATAS